VAPLLGDRLGVPWRTLVAPLSGSNLVAPLSGSDLVAPVSGSDLVAPLFGGLGIDAGGIPCYIVM